MNSKWIGVIFLFFGMALFGSATPISKLVGEGFPVFTASTLRVILGSLFLLPFICKNFSTNLISLDKKAWIEIGLITLFGMVGFTFFLITGMKYITGVAGSIIMSTTPAITALGAYLFLGSSLDWRRSLAILLGIAGIILINVFKGSFDDASSSHFYLGVLFVLLAIVCEAIYTLMGKKAVEKIEPLFTSFLSCILSIPLFLILALLIDYKNFHLNNIGVNYWYALIWWGMGTLGAGSALWYSGIKRAEGTIAAGFMSVMPLSALLLSYFLLDEPFRLIHVPGIMLVLSSIVIMSWVHVESKNKTN